MFGAITGLFTICLCFFESVEIYYDLLKCYGEWQEVVVCKEKVAHLGRDEG